MKKFASILFIFSLIGTASFAQKEKIFTDKGNAALEKGDFAEAKSEYKKALEINPDYKEAIFNLGNAYQLEARTIVETLANAGDENAKKEIYEKAKKASKEAAAQYKKASEDLKDPDKINKAQYNLGNAELMSGDVDKSIEAYKEALRKVPTDDDARYNLAYAQHMKKKQEQQEQNKDQDKENQDQDQKDQKDQEQNKDQDQKKEEQQKNEQQQQNNELSEEEAEKMLEALNKQEKDIQDKLKKKKIKVQPIKIEKDW